MPHPTAWLWAKVMTLQMLQQGKGTQDGDSYDRLWPGKAGVSGSWCGG
jgi:hypothetical protein